LVIVTSSRCEVVLQQPDVGLGVEAGVADPQGFVNVSGLVGILDPIPADAEAFCDLSNAEERVVHGSPWFLIRHLYVVFSSPFSFTSVEESW